MLRIVTGGGTLSSTLVSSGIDTQSRANSLAPGWESKPSRGTSGARGEQESAKTLSFRCDCERCRLMRGAEESSRHPELVSASQLEQIAQQACCHLSRGAVSTQKRGGNLNHIQTFAI